MRRYLARAKEFVARHPDVEWYISPELESNCHGKAARNMLAFAKAEFPQAHIVWNPVINAPQSCKPIPGYLHELHGLDVPTRHPCIWSFDGVDIDLHPTRTPLPERVQPSFARDLMKYTNYCRVSFVWVREMNCIKPGAFIPPRQRTACSVPKEVRGYLR